MELSRTLQRFPYRKLTYWPNLPNTLFKAAQTVTSDPKATFDHKKFPQSANLIAFHEA